MAPEKDFEAKMELEERPRDLRQKSTCVQVVLGLIVSLSSMAPSMSLGFSAVALPYLSDMTKEYHLNPSEASWFASIASISAPLGCFLSGPISDRFGRRPAIFCVNIFCFLGWGVIALAYYFPVYQYATLLIGRFLTGLSTGLSSMPASVYMAEVSTAKLRGMLITWNALCFSLGVVVVYALGWMMTYNWGMVAVISATIPCACTIMVIVYMVESPSWLIGRNRLEEAKASMRKLYDTKEYTTEMCEELKTLIGNKGVAKLKPSFSWRPLLEPTFYKPFVLMSAFFLFQQLTGTFVIVFYAIDIVNGVNIKLDPYLAIVLIATTRTVTSVFVSLVSKRVGRRPLTLTSGAGMTVCLLTLAGYVICIEKDVITAGQHSWIPLTSLMAYYLTATLGFLTMPFAMSAEVFPSEIRGLATGTVTSIGYLGSFVMVKMYPDMLDAMGTYPLYLFYATMSFIATFFTALFLPETRDKTLAEIEDEFRNGANKKRSAIELESVYLTT